ncbi:hypothetical protein F7725_019859, partial [Dissostichus mawsoni]
MESQVKPDLGPGFAASHSQSGSNAERPLCFLSSLCWCQSRASELQRSSSARRPSSPDAARCSSAQFVSAAASTSSAWWPSVGRRPPPAAASVASWPPGSVNASFEEKNSRQEVTFVPAAGHWAVLQKLKNCLLGTVGSFPDLNLSIDAAQDIQNSVTGFVRFLCTLQPRHNRVQRRRKAGVQTIPRCPESTLLLAELRAASNGSEEGHDWSPLLSEGAKQVLKHLKNRLTGEREKGWTTGNSYSTATRREEIITPLSAGDVELPLGQVESLLQVLLVAPGLNQREVSQLRSERAQDGQEDLSTSPARLKVLHTDRATDPRQRKKMEKGKKKGKKGRSVSPSCRNSKTSVIAFPSQLSVPTQVPSLVTSRVSSQVPSQVPFRVPSQVPSPVPTQVPSLFPTPVPTQSPLESPLEFPLKSLLESSLEFPLESPLESLLKSHLESLLEFPLESLLEFPLESPLKSPLESLLEFPLKFLLQSPLESPLEFALKSPLKSPLESLLEFPLKFLLESPLKSPLESLLQSPLESPLEFPLKSPLKSPLESLLEFPLKFLLQSPLKSLSSLLLSPFSSPLSSLLSSSLSSHLSSLLSSPFSSSLSTFVQRRRPARRERSRRAAGPRVQTAQGVQRGVTRAVGQSAGQLFNLKHRSTHMTVEDDGPYESKGDGGTSIYDIWD